MISVHNTFVCKPGNASKVAKLFKEWADSREAENMTVMTDMTGGWHRVILTESYPSLAAYEEEQANMGRSREDKEMMEKFKDVNEMYVSGSREIFKVW
jgi:hypothetical protein